MSSNFFIFLDREGKMPVFDFTGRKVEIDHHPYYVRYVGGKPVGFHGPAELVASDNTKTKIWDYSINEYVPIGTIPQE